MEGPVGFGTEAPGAAPVRAGRTVCSIYYIYKAVSIQMCNQEQIPGYRDILQDIKTPYRMQTHRAIGFVPQREKPKPNHPIPEPHTNPSPRQPPPTVQPGLFTRRKGVSKSRQTEPPPQNLEPPSPGDGDKRQKWPRGDPSRGLPSSWGCAIAESVPGVQHFPKNSNSKSKAAVTNIPCFPDPRESGCPYNSRFPLVLTVPWGPSGRCRRCRHFANSFVSFIPLPGKDRRGTLGICIPRGSCAFFFSVRVGSWSLPSEPLHSRPKHGSTFPHSPLTEASWLKALSPFSTAPFFSSLETQDKVYGGMKGWRGRRTPQKGCQWRRHPPARLWLHPPPTTSMPISNPGPCNH
ncbi:uncharacterized protein LOC113975162 isoform X2 [Neopelma chrysocephalum]|nr:uncharacterized protein LOC113975162 isoform X2 [Neopelma chrysocephalum]